MKKIEVYRLSNGELFQSRIDKFRRDGEIKIEIESLISKRWNRYHAKLSENVLEEITDIIFNNKEELLKILNK